MIELRREVPSFDITGTLMKDERNKALHEIGEKALQQIQQQIEQSGINDARGKVKSWQQLRYGSKGGYVAISPEASSTGANSPGAITNYLESGHSTKLGLGKSKRYKPRGKKAVTTGFHFYQKSDSEIEKMVDTVIGRLEEELKEKAGR